MALLFLEQAKRKHKLSELAFKEALSSVENRLQETWAGKAVDLEFLESLVPKENTELLGLMGLAERLSPLLFNASTVQANPRLIKRFLNTVFLRQTLAKPQGIDADIQILAKWHLLERCDETVANTLARQVSSQNEGRIQSIQNAEKAILSHTDDLIPELFTEKPFLLEWLRLQPMIGDIDMRPILHLSRDCTIRDFGVDDLNEDGKKLRDALLKARNVNSSLEQLIKETDSVQAGLAMSRVWDLMRSKRTWSKGNEVVALKAVTKIYPDLGPRAASLVKQAPTPLLTPAFIAALSGLDWMQEIFSEWENDSLTTQETKRAIQRERGH